jgi:hypothetical protein
LQPECSGKEIEEHSNVTWIYHHKEKGSTFQQSLTTVASLFRTGVMAKLLECLLT